METRQPSMREQRVAECRDLPRQVGQGCGASNSIILGFFAESGGVVQIIGGIIESSPSAAQSPKSWAVGGRWSNRDRQERAGYPYVSPRMPIP